MWQNKHIATAVSARECPVSDFRFAKILHAPRYTVVGACGYRQHVLPAAPSEDLERLQQIHHHWRDMAEMCGATKRNDFPCASNKTCIDIFVLRLWLCLWSRTRISMLRKESTQDLVKPESPWETLNRFQRNLSALQDDDHDDDPDDHDDDDNHRILRIGSANLNILMRILRIGFINVNILMRILRQGGDNLNILMRILRIGFIDCNISIRKL